MPPYKSCSSVKYLRHELWDMSLWRMLLTSSPIHFVSHFKSCEYCEKKTFQQKYFSLPPIFIIFNSIFTLLTFSDDVLNYYCIFVLGNFANIVIFPFLHSFNFKAITNTSSCGKCEKGRKCQSIKKIVGWFLLLQL